MRHDRPIEKRGGFCELTDTPSARARSYQRDRPKGPLWPLCFITSTNCADAHVRKQGKQKTWYYCTTESQLSTDHWSMEKTSNKTQHRDCHGTTEFISSVRTIPTNIHPPTHLEEREIWTGPFPWTLTEVQSTATLLWEYSGHQSTAIWRDPLTGWGFFLAVTNYWW